MRTIVAAAVLTVCWSVSLAQLAHDAGVLDPRGGSPLRLTQDTTSTPR